MNTIVRKFRPPIKTHGGKWYGCRFINPILETVLHDTFIEPFGGGFSCCLNKSKAKREIYNDIDWCKFTLFKIIRDDCDRFLEILSGVSYDEETFLASKINNEYHKSNHTSIDPMNAAVHFMIRSRMSRGGMGKSFAYGTRLRGGIPGDANAWFTNLKQLPEISHRLKDVEIQNLPATKLISNFNDESTLIYCDAPYPHMTRKSINVYDHEMSNEQHVEYLKAAKCSKSRFVISSYRNTLYNDILKGWKTLEFNMPNHSGQGSDKERRTEVLYLNY